MTYPHHGAPPSGLPAHAPASALVGLGGFSVNWPAFVARSALRAAVLWPVIRFVGGAGPGRAAAAGVLAGAALTGIELAFDSAGVLTAHRALDGHDPFTPPNVIDVTGFSE